MLPGPERPCPRSALRLAAGLVVTLALGSCAKHTPAILAPAVAGGDLTLALASGPITITDSLSVSVYVAWSAAVPGASIDHVEYAPDPPSLVAAAAHAETAWVATRLDHATLRFAARHGPAQCDYNVVAVRAFDAAGRKSPVAVRAFYSYTVAPDVQIAVPPAASGSLVVPHPFRLTWQGDDPDGPAPHAPASYFVRLVSLDGVAGSAYLADPDSLRREAIATRWAGWRALRGDTSALVLDDSLLPPGGRWLAAIVAVDILGATTPYMILGRNLLPFTVDPSAGPQLHVYSPLIDYTSQPGSLTFVAAAAPAEQLLTFHWDGLPPAGRAVETRWALDLANPNDDTPRSGPDDLAHWSAFTTGTGTAAFTLTAYGRHDLWIDARDDFGSFTTVVVKIDAFQATLDRELLIVDDTRLEPDRFAFRTGGGCPLTYTKRWPSAAELDTLLYAVGGVPWRCAQDPAALTRPGLFAGYAFDTLGTRLGLEDPGSAPALAALLRYRRVLWLIDAASAQSPFGGTSLRAMSAPGRTSTLSAYVTAGGEVWLAGGGGAYASLVNFSPRNGADSLRLGPGRLLYDFAHLRSAIAVSVAVAEPQRSAAARGGWSDQGPSGKLSAPDYSRLPATLRLRTPDTDAIPPTRTANQAGLVYPGASTWEYVAAPNDIREDVDPDPAVDRQASTLDTLYDVTNPQLSVRPAPVMLYYHGLENAPFVFTGFDLWSWTHDDCQGLVDFVLHDIWGMNKAPAGGAARIGVPGTRPARVPRPRLDPARGHP